MAIKTITVTEDAYNAIKRVKYESESFSELFKRISRVKYCVKDIAGAIKLSGKEYAELKKRTAEFRKKASKDAGERRRKCIS